MRTGIEIPHAPGQQREVACLTWILTGHTTLFWYQVELASLRSTAGTKKGAVPFGADAFCRNGEK